ncbi:MAG: TIM barrel protein [Spirochaetota bacterium]|nr:MAG: TIM barrel protein [Spirochaetota bacterium]
MSEIGVCIETFFSDLDYEKRIERIYRIGFKSYEFWFHNARFDGKKLIDEPKDFDMIAELNEKFNLKVSDFVFNHPDGGIMASLIDKHDRNKILDNLEEMISFAKKLDCKQLISASGNKKKDIGKEEAIENMIETLLLTMKICEREDITLLLEPWNTKVDHPDCFLDDPEIALKVLKEVNHKNAKMLYDIYHMQIMKGNVTSFIQENIQYIGHFHIAGVPGRNEPVNCELNYQYIVREIDKTGYKGLIGLEYWPTMDHKESLKKTMTLFK